MLQQTLISIDDRDQWNDELADIPHAPAHLWSYNSAMRESKFPPHFLYCAKYSKFKALCPISIREKSAKLDILTPYGFGGMITRGQYPHFAQDWFQFWVNNNYVCGYILLHPLFNHEFTFNFHNITPGNSIYIIDLKLPLDKLFKKISKIHRYEIRKWEKANFELVTDLSRLEADFFPLYQETLKRVNAHSIYYFSKKTISELIKSNYAIVIGAAFAGKIEAISIFLYTSHIADYFINASSEAGKIHTRGLLLWGINILKNLSIPYLNLGGGAKPNDHLDHFKRNFGGEHLTTQSLKQIYNQSSFNKLCESNAINNYYFPPYHVIK